jgi:hypothetical protein
MKKIIFTISLWLIGLTATFAQFGYEFINVENIKKGKIVIGLLPYPKHVSDEEKADIDKINRLLESTVRQYWTFSEIHGAFHSKETKKMVKKNPHFFIIEPFLVSSNLKTGNVNFKSSNYALTLYRGGGSLERKAMIMYPYAENGVDKALLAYMVTALQFQLELVHRKQFSSTNEAFRNTNAFKDELSSKILLIPQDMLDSRITNDIFAQHYPFPFEFCSRTKYNDVILKKDDKYAYVVYTLWPAASTYLDYYFFVNASDGAFYASVDLSKKFKVLFVAKNEMATHNYQVEKNPKPIGLKQLKHIQSVWDKNVK